MKRRYANVDFMIALFVGGLIIGFFSFTFYNYISHFVGFLLLVLNFGVITCLYIYMRNRNEKNLHNFIRDAIFNIKKIAGGSQASYHPDFTMPELKDLYDTLSQMQVKMASQSRVKEAVLRIINTMTLSLDLDELLDKLLPKINEETNSSWSAFYTYNQSTEKLQLKKSIGFSKNIYNEFDVDPGEGFSGNAIQADKIEIIENISDDTIFVSRSFLGKIKPKSIMCVPISFQGNFLACLLLAGVNSYEKEHLDITNMIRYHLGVSLNNCIHFERVERLKNELQFQNQLIHDLNSELEDKVMHRTRFLNSIIDTISDYAISAIDTNYIVTTWNKGAEQLRGFSKEEAVGSHVGEIYPTENTIGKVPVESKLKMALENGAFEETGWFTRRDGQRIYANLIVKPMYNDKGTLEGFSSITKDITSICKLEQQLSYEKHFSTVLFNQNPYALLAVNADGLIQAANPYAQEVLGENQRNITGSQIFKYVTDTNLMRLNIKKALEDGNERQYSDDILSGNKLVLFQIRIIAIHHADENASRALLIQLQ